MKIGASASELDSILLASFASDAIKISPSEPNQPSSQQHILHRSRVNFLVLPRSEEKSQSQTGRSGSDVDGGAAGKVEFAERFEPAKRTPHPGLEERGKGKERQKSAILILHAHHQVSWLIKTHDEEIIAKSAPKNQEKRHGPNTNALSAAADDNDRGDGGKHALEEHEDVGGDGGSDEHGLDTDVAEDGVFCFERKARKKRKIELESVKIEELIKVVIKNRRTKVADKERAGVRVRKREPKEEVLKRNHDGAGVTDGHHRENGAFAAPSGVEETETAVGLRGERDGRSENERIEFRLLCNASESRIACITYPGIRSMQMAVPMKMKRESTIGMHSGSELGSAFAGV